MRLLTTLPAGRNFKKLTLKEQPQDMLIFKALTSLTLTSRVLTSPVPTSSGHSPLTPTTGSLLTCLFSTPFSLAQTSDGLISQALTLEIPSALPPRNSIPRSPMKKPNFPIAYQKNKTNPSNSSQRS